MRKTIRRDFGTLRLSGSAVEAHLKAEQRVKGKPFLRTNVVRWLLDFSFSDSSRFFKADWHAVRWEALVFAYDSFEENIMPRGPLPTENEVMAKKEWLLALWSDLEKGKFAIIPAVTPARILKFQDGRLHGIAPTNSLPWSQAFTTRVYEILTADDVVGRFRFCLECRRPFFAQKRQAYCSTSCSQKRRTREWRQNNPGKFRAARRAAYRRQKQAELGMS